MTKYMATWNKAVWNFIVFKTDTRDRNWVNV